MKIYLVLNDTYYSEIDDSTRVFLNENSAKIYAAIENDAGRGDYTVEEFEVSDDEVEIDPTATVNYKYRTVVHINYNKDGTFEVVMPYTILDYTLTLEKPSIIINEKLSNSWKVYVFVIRDHPFEGSEKDLFENIVRENATEYIKRRLQKYNQYKIGDYYSL